MTRKTLQSCHERQRRTLECEPVAEYPRGSAFPRLPRASGKASGLWVAWNVDGIRRGAAGVAVRQMVGRVLPAALKELYLPFDPDFNAFSWSNREHLITEISTKIHPAEVVTELAMIAPIQYRPGA